MVIDSDIVFNKSIDLKNTLVNRCKEVINNSLFTFDKERNAHFIKLTLQCNVTKEKKMHKSIIQLKITSNKRNRKDIFFGAILNNVCVQKLLSKDNGL